jgi:hypothetical protein
MVSNTFLFAQVETQEQRETKRIVCEYETRLASYAKNVIEFTRAIIDPNDGRKVPETNGSTIVDKLNDFFSVCQS